MPAGAATVVERVIPYVGLRPFRRDEAALFFGRDSHADALLEKLGQTHFLAVLAPSGYGKSSLVRTGLLPGLIGGYLTQTGTRWRIADMRPEDQPLRNLAEALCDALEDIWLAELDKAERRTLLEDLLREGPYSLHPLWQEMQPRLPAGSHLLILVDQFEELFRYYASANPAQDGHSAVDETLAFIALLLAVSQHPDLYIVITMRSDFISDCAQFHGLPEAINQGLYLVPRLTRQQLREAIAMPARVCGGQLEESLVNQMINDAGTDPDQLPLIQHALLRMWLSGKGEVGLQDYHHPTIGGIKRALHNHAESLYASLDQAQQRIAGILFRSLTELQNQRAIRRPAAIQEIAELAGVTWRAVAEVAEVFRQPGCHFLMPPPEHPLDAHSKLDISHESLIRQWDRLREWVVAEAEAAGLCRDLAQSAREWQAKEAGVWRGIKLARAKQWLDQLDKQYRNLRLWAQRYGQPIRLIREFIRASLAARWRSRVYRFTALAGAFISISLIAAVFWQQRQSALQAEALFISELARQENAKTHPSTAMRLALEALPGSSDTRWRPFVQAASQQLFEAINTHTHGIFEHDAPVRSAAFSHDSKLISTLSGGIAYFWDSRDYRLQQTLQTPGADILYTAFSPDGSRFLTAGADLRLWDSASLKELAQFGGHQAAITLAALSADNRRLASASEEGVVRLWDIAECAVTRCAPRLIQELRGHQGGLSALLFSPDGRHLLTASSDYTAGLWQAETGALEQVLRGHQDSLTTAAFTPDSRFIVTGADDRTVRLWNVESGAAVAVLREHQAGITALAISPDGRFLVTAAGDAGALAWHLQACIAGQCESSARLSGLNTLTAMAFSPDNRFLAIASADGAIQLWDTSGEFKQALTTLNQEKAITSLSFSPDSRQLLSAADDGVARLWETDINQHPMLFQHEYPVNMAAFSPDGKLMASAAGGNILVYNRTTQEVVQRVRSKNIFTGIIFSPDSRHILVTSDQHETFLSDTDISNYSSLENDNTKLTPASFSSDSNRIVGVFNDGGFWMWGIPDNKFETFELPDKGEGYNQKKIIFAAFSPDNNLLALVCDDKTVRIWKDNQEILRLNAIASQGAVSAAFSPDSRRLVTASYDKTARVWDAHDGRQLLILRGHEDTLTSASFSPDGKLVITSSLDNTARIWDAVTGRELSILEGHDGAVNSVMFSPDGKQAITASSDKTVRLWPVFGNTEDMIEYARHILPRDKLTCKERKRFFITTASDCQ